MMKRGSAYDEVELVICRQAVTDIEPNKARLGNGFSIDAKAS